MKMREQFLQEYQTQVLDSLLLPPCLKEQYNVISCLKDGKRQVYLIKDQAGWPAVLKIQDADREDSLRQEYDLLQELHHPQIPRPLVYIEWEGREYMIREYVEGISLYDQVTSQGPLPAAKVREAAMSLCTVLQYLHSRKPPIICRDVKPQNVIRDPSGCCHLIDLGTARYHRPEKQGDTVLLGTRVTAPPEQFGYQQTDQRSDIYSLGILMHFLHTGSFNISSPHITSDFTGSVIRRCCAFDPKKRYSSVRSVYRALKYHLQFKAAAAFACLLCIAIIFFLFPYLTAKDKASSSLLEDAIRWELNLDEDESIPQDRLDEVKQLLICGQMPSGSLNEHEELAIEAHDRGLGEAVYGDISNDDLKLLSKCVNLKVLVLDYQNISDLSPLSDLPLEYLSLAGNHISDLSPLSDMSELQVLNLAENPVSSVDGLGQLTGLDEVTLEATGITSVEAFSGSSIRSLNVRGTWVTDFSPLNTCAELSHLIVGELPGGAAESLTGLTNLVELRLYSTPDIDLSGFTGFKKLRDLDLYGSSISNPQSLALLPELRYLNLGETGISDLSFLTQLPAITDVALRDNALTDLSPLSDCPWLSLVTLSRQHQMLAEKQLPDASFTIQYK